MGMLPFLFRDEAAGLMGVGETVRGEAVPWLFSQQSGAYVRGCVRHPAGSFLLLCSVVDEFHWGGKPAAGLSLKHPQMRNYRGLTGIGGCLAPRSRGAVEHP
jgi:hypothetical protein